MTKYRCSIWIISSSMAPYSWANWCRRRKWSLTPARIGWWSKAELGVKNAFILTLKTIVATTPSMIFIQSRKPDSAGKVCKIFFFKLAPPQAGRPTCNKDNHPKKSRRPTADAFCICSFGELPQKTPRAQGTQWNHEVLPQSFHEPSSDNSDAENNFSNTFLSLLSSGESMDERPANKKSKRAKKCR